MNKHSLEEMQRLRNRGLQDLSSYMESYMRSPAFLELMRYNMLLMSHARRPAIPGGSFGFGTPDAERPQRAARGSPAATVTVHADEGQAAAAAASAVAAASHADRPGGGASSSALARMDRSKEFPAAESPPAATDA
jgi:hypothetical protein